MTPCPKCLGQDLCEGSAAASRGGGGGGCDAEGLLSAISTMPPIEKTWACYSSLDDPWSQLFAPRCLPEIHSVQTIHAEQGRGPGRNVTISIHTWAVGGGDAEGSLSATPAMSPMAKTCACCRTRSMASVCISPRLSVGKGSDNFCAIVFVTGPLPAVQKTISDSITCRGKTFTATIQSRCWQLQRDAEDV